jgi:hypothetical protein
MCTDDVSIDGNDEIFRIFLNATLISADFTAQKYPKKPGPLRV